MERKEFLKICGLGCLGLAGMSFLLQSCGTTKYIDAPLKGDFMLLPITAFDAKEGKTLSHVIAQNDKLEYPMYVYRFTATEYSAVLMKCTHQGVELQAFGDRLQCPAHGSEFTNTGMVTNGPADTSLRGFKVSIENNTLKISLK